jgi:hypothetical protein
MNNVNITVERDMAFSSEHEDLATAPTRMPLWVRSLAAVVVLLWLGSFVFGFETSLALISFLGFVAAIIGLSKPKVGLIGVGIMFMLDPLTRVYLSGQGALPWNSLNYWLVIVGFLFIKLIFQLRDPQSRWLAALILILVFYLIPSSRPFYGFQFILNLASTFGVLVYFSRVAEDMRVWRYMGFVNGVVAGIGGGIFFLQRDILSAINANAFAYFPICAILSISMISFIGPNLRKRGSVALIGLLAINMLWVFLSGSRGGMIVSLVSAAFFLSNVRNHGQRLSFATEY